MIDPATPGMQLSKLMTYLQRMLRQSEHDIAGPLGVSSGPSELYHPRAAFPESGHSDHQYLSEVRGRFRPIAAVKKFLFEFPLDEPVWSCSFEIVGV